MLTKRFLNLAEWGFNVPLFLCNPCMSYGRDAYSTLKFFAERHGIRKATLYASRRDGKKNKELPHLTIQDAFLRASYLESASYEVIFLEDIPYEFSGRAVICSDETGSYSIQKFTSARKIEGRFGFFESIEDKKIRHIIRTLYPIRHKTKQDTTVFFSWAKEFTGVNHLKLITYDYILI